MIPTAAPWAQTAAQAEQQQQRGDRKEQQRREERREQHLNGSSVSTANSSKAPSQDAQQQQDTGNVPVQQKFVPARKALRDAKDLQHFLDSEACQDYIAWILRLNAVVTGRSLSDAAQNPSEQVLRLCHVLDVLGNWVPEIPPQTQALRYGNPAFRTWFARLTQEAPSLLQQALAPQFHPAIIELTGYFVDSFGNATRIDYGTGHETTFNAFLYCLNKLGVFSEDDHACVVSLVFNKYVNLMRYIQTTYWLEPAGSHGVWGLDDYNFLPFIWGSAQLINHPLIRPKSIHNPDILEEFGDEYLYLQCIKFVKQVKKGPLQETSPMICDISHVPNWTKVNSGMIKMYRAELLGKFPIMQHFLFGSIIPFQRPNSS